MLMDILPLVPPMKSRIPKFMTDFIQASKAGDNLYLHCKPYVGQIPDYPAYASPDSGHGGQTRTKDSDEPDGKDEGTLLPRSKSVAMNGFKSLYLGIYPADFVRYQGPEKMLSDNVRFSWSSIVIGLSDEIVHLGAE